MTTRPKIRRADVVIVGAGIAGASLAYFLARKGVRPLVLDRSSPAAEASGANAGMIGASGGIPGKTLALSQLSAELYDHAMVELDDPINFHRKGRLLLAHSAEDVAEREAFVRERRNLGIEVEMLYGQQEVLKIEPILSEQVIAAAYVPDDGHIDPFRATVSYLSAACQLGAMFEAGISVDRLLVSNGAIHGVAAGGENVAAKQVVLAAGAWTPALAATAGVKLPMFPGRGQLLVSAPVAPLTSHVLRAMLIGMRQMNEGNLVFGSEVELVGFNKHVVPAKLARYAQLTIQTTVPALANVRIERTWAGLRPMTADNLPIIGAIPDIIGLHLLTGHGRSGMSLGPASAFAVAETIVTGRTDVPIETLGLHRFR